MASSANSFVGALVAARAYLISECVNSEDARHTFTAPLPVIDLDGVEESPTQRLDEIVAEARRRVAARAAADAQRIQESGFAATTPTP